MQPGSLGHAGDTHLPWLFAGMCGSTSVFDANTSTCTVDASGSAIGEKSVLVAQPSAGSIELFTVRLLPVGPAAATRTTLISLALSRCVLMLAQAAQALGILPHCATMLCLGQSRLPLQGRCCSRRHGLQPTALAPQTCSCWGMQAATSMATASRRWMLSTAPHCRISWLPP